MITQQRSNGRIAFVVNDVPQTHRLLDTLPLGDCEGCRLGMAIFNGDELEKCDECGLYEYDDDAAAVLNWLAHATHEHRKS